MRKVQFCVGVSCWGRGGCLLFVFMKRDLPQTKLNHHRLADWMHDPDVRDEYCTTQLNHPRLDIRFIDAKLSHACIFWDRLVLNLSVSLPC